MLDRIIISQKAKDMKNEHLYGKSPLENPEILKLLQVLCNANEYLKIMYMGDD